MEASESTSSRLRARLEEVVAGLSQLITTVPVLWFDRFGSPVVRPEYYWADLSAEQRAFQMSLKRSYESASELLRLLLTRAPESLISQFEGADKKFRVWLEFQSNWSLSPTIPENEAHLRAVGAAFEQVLGVLDVTGAREVLVIPDTNSLLSHPDPVEYRSVVMADDFAFTLLPTVLGELDRLKIEHRNPEVREKAKAAIARIKGWRRQGSLSAGVTVDKTITVRACHREPDMGQTLSWLDRDIQDDRIIASVIALQSEHPSSRVVLVTGDINLQNKADAAVIETAEVP